MLNVIICIILDWEETMIIKISWFILETLCDENSSLSVQESMCVSKTEIKKTSDSYKISLMNIQN